MNIQLRLILILTFSMSVIAGSLILLGYTRNITCGEIVWQDYDEYGNVKVELRECDIGKLRQEGLQ